MTRPELAIGVIADDFTGASDIANTLVQGGLRTVLAIGPPRDARDFGSPEALVVALKTRSIAADDAVAQSIEALDALRARGARHIVFKYCSTFDSTDAGNIGPVADGLRERLGAKLAIHCPAFPANGRRVFGGYLFVGDVLLSESGMRDHPLTPMHDANLVRVLKRQTRYPVERIDFGTVRSGRAAIAEATRELASRGVRHAIVDAVSEDDLKAIGTAAIDTGIALICGGSGIALGLPAAVQVEAPEPDRRSAALPSIAGRAAILAASCSMATRAQIAYVRDRLPTYDLNDGSLDEPERRVEESLAWAEGIPLGHPVLILASADPARVAENQRKYGVAEAGARIERMMAEIARGLRARGFARFIVAGGETSGAVVEGLSVDALRVGPEIDPGVPWTATLDASPIALALKSGNFGAEDFFIRALEHQA